MDIPDNLRFGVPVRGPVMSKMRMSQLLRYELEQAMASMEADTPYNSPDAFRRLEKALGYRVDSQGYPVLESQSEKEAGK